MLKHESVRPTGFWDINVQYRLDADAERRIENRIAHLRQKFYHAKQRNPSRDVGKAKNDERDEFKENFALEARSFVNVVKKVQVHELPWNCNYISQKLRVEIIKGRGNNACGRGNNA